MESNIWKMHVLNLFTGMMFITGVLVPFFMIWGGLNYFQIMLIMAWSSFLIFFLEIPTGAIADKHGRKFSMSIAALFIMLGTIVYVIVPNFFIFLVAETFWAIGLSLWSGAYTALIYDTLKSLKREKESKKIFGRLTSYNVVGLLIGSSAGGLMAEHLGLRAPMILMVIPFSIALLIIFSLTEPKYHKKIIQILALDMVVLAGVSGMLFWLAQLLLSDLGLRLAFMGFVYAAFNVFQILFMNSYSWFEKILGSKKRLLFFSSLVVGVSILVSGLFMSLPVILVAFALASSFGLGREPLIDSYLQKHMPSKQRATSSSILNMFMLINT